MPPTLTVCNTDLIGEQIQRAFPDAKVVKTLDTINCNVMVTPHLVPGTHDIFMSGNNAKAKAKVHEIVTDWFGWKFVIDLGRHYQCKRPGDVLGAVDTVDGSQSNPEL